MASVLQAASRQVAVKATHYRPIPPTSSIVLYLKDPLKLRHKRVFACRCAGKHRAEPASSSTTPQPPAEVVLACLPLLRKMDVLRQASCTTHLSSRQMSNRQESAAQQPTLRDRHPHNTLVNASLLVALILAFLLVFVCFSL